MEYEAWVNDVAKMGLTLDNSLTWSSFHTALRSSKS